ncbi:hypothetical protein FOPG_19809 [Fusarium oxysporum f. sp. conglutinans race 2 54008]|uniref:Uncharacterized protein n=1 Tax=Fusarium oxysporum f. sp. conglutinans race 2 54008 TaxID=1089457 RepID=X0GKT8_FUSOX|nr:hypothetical protein FOPG_19809 [Fusarium oxysporum f. sp. conglutinans race 2 54008]
MFLQYLHLRTYACPLSTSMVQLVLLSEPSLRMNPLEQSFSLTTAT